VIHSAIVQLLFARHDGDVKGSRPSGQAAPAIVFRPRRSS
jgi:hypothetical protein